MSYIMKILNIGRKLWNDFDTLISLFEKNVGILNSHLEQMNNPKTSTKTYQSILEIFFNEKNFPYPYFDTYQCHNL